MCVIEDRIIPVDEGLKHRWLHIASENEHLLLPEGPFNMSIVNTMHDELLRIMELDTFEHESEYFVHLSIVNTIHEVFRIMELERYYDYFINHHHQQHYAMMFVHQKKKKKNGVQKKKKVYAPVVSNNKQHQQQRRQQQHWKTKYTCR